MNIDKRMGARIPIKGMLLKELTKELTKDFGIDNESVTIVR